MNMSEPSFESTDNKSGRRSGNERNRRMFASIQSTLGSSTTSPSSSSHKTRQVVKNDESAEKLENVQDIISQISDLCKRADRSAAQIKRNITASPILNTLEERDWITLCDTLIDVAVHGEAEFAVDIFVPFMGHDLFCDVICSRLMTVCSAYIMDPTEDQDPASIPNFLGSVMCFHWPRNLSKAIDSVNPVLFTVVSIVKGWLLVLSEDIEFMNSAESACSEDDDDDSEVKPCREDPLIVNRCAFAVSSLCSATQRSLWMKWPEICDEIYEALKPTITHNNVVTGDVKTGLLFTMMQLNTWTKSKSATMKNSQTQTVSLSVNHNSY